MLGINDEEQNRRLALLTENSQIRVDQDGLHDNRIPNTKIVAHWHVKLMANLCIHYDYGETCSRRVTRENPSGESLTHLINFGVEAFSQMITVILSRCC